MSKYTVEIKHNGKSIYPKEICLGFNYFEVSQWTENKQEAVWWASYEATDYFATNYDNINIIKIEGNDND